MPPMLRVKNSYQASVIFNELVLHVTRRGTFSHSEEKDQILEGCRPERRSGQEGRECGVEI